MSVLWLLTIMVVLIILPLIIMLLVHYWYNRPDPMHLRGVPGGVCILLYSFVIVYYVIFFNFGKDVLDKYYPLQTESKMVCEVKTLSWREGLTP